MEDLRNGHTVIAPEKADCDFDKTEMKYDSTGMFHWTPSRSLEDCILVRLELKEGQNKTSHFTGPKPGCNDSAQWACGGLLICRT